MAFKIVVRQKEDCDEKHDLVCLSDTIKNRHSVLAQHHNAKADAPE